MSPEAQTVAKNARAGKVSVVRELLEKADREGLSASESILLKGELARLKARIAAVNARCGMKVVELGPFAGKADQAGASPALAV